MFFSLLKNTHNLSTMDSPRLTPDPLDHLPVPAIEQPGCGIHAGLLTAEAYSDMTIRCEGRDFKVHKVIMCTRSPVLRASMDSGCREAVESVYTIDRYPARMVDSMIKFCYTGSYDGPSAGEENDDDGSDCIDNEADYDDPPGVLMEAVKYHWASIKHHTTLNAMGDFFLIDDLTTYTHKKVQTHLAIWLTIVGTERSIRVTKPGYYGMTESLSYALDSEEAGNADVRSPTGPQIGTASLARALPKMARFAYEHSGDKMLHRLFV
jgi:hypothetical protein